jgi:hypothetical protein
MRVFNNTDRALSVERWTIFPKSSRCINQRGKVFMELPEDVAHTDTGSSKSSSTPQFR